MKYTFTEKKFFDELMNGKFLVYFDEEETTESVSNEDGVESTYHIWRYKMAMADSLEKGVIVDAIIRTQYSQADVEAIFRHKLAGEDDEFTEFNAFAEAAKTRANEIIANI